MMIETYGDNAWPAGLSAPARRALAAAGYTSLAQLAQLRETEIAALHGMGPKGVRILREALSERGQHFAA
jgi:predicted flap endonuclease-1-like 5' DNA nuclease